MPEMQRRYDNNNIDVNLRSTSVGMKLPNTLNVLQHCFQ